jgi:SH3-like domain-containing protein
MPHTFRTPHARRCALRIAPPRAKQALMRRPTPAPPTTARLRPALIFVLALLMVLPSPPWTAGGALAQEVAKGASGLPLPRFVSLKSSRVNVRRGPGQDYDVAWSYVKAGLPVEIVQEFENWRKIRDWEGSEGWVFHSLLSGRRTGIVAPWTQGTRFPVREEPNTDARIVAQLESRVVTDVARCDGAWCEVRGEGYSGWMEQDSLWGVYPQEAVEAE